VSLSPSGRFERTRPAKLAAAILGFPGISRLLPTRKPCRSSVKARDRAGLLGCLGIEFAARGCRGGCCLTSAVHRPPVGPAACDTSTQVTRSLQWFPRSLTLKRHNTSAPPPPAAEGGGERERTRRQKEGRAERGRSGEESSRFTRVVPPIFFSGRAIEGQKKRPKNPGARPPEDQHVLLACGCVACCPRPKLRFPQNRLARCGVWRCTRKAPTRTAQTVMDRQHGMANRECCVYVHL